MILGFSSYFISEMKILKMKKGLEAGAVQPENRL